MEINGFRLLPGHLSTSAQAALVTEVRELLARAPLYRPKMPGTGAPLSVAMSNAGPLGWVSDRDGYRYQPHHPVTGAAWPAIPQTLLDLWDDLSLYPAPPEACLINWYGDTKARMGLHRDLDEVARDAPVLSVSLGARATFRIGGTRRRDPTKSVRLSSGDVVVMAGQSREAYHGIDRIWPGTSTLLPDPQRLNLTLRRVTLPKG